ncbi:hypothetical protein VFPFJ_11576 [Purpureocillium lilacinum]|uniref:Uncharacterized protein n=1 Tax=Purpureocillium lilacinum TaxID=33203 RepID=A0A179F2G8_PURLI|nr:hypothetical protein VFPFJ_11576 [Purpureocillium lilacinum]OAQ59510.1 hypothetical protein VFPFJ_11576 [Purpureocillium lilacinum]
MRDGGQQDGVEQLRWCEAKGDGVEWCEAKRVGVKRSEMVCGSARRLFWLPDNGKQMRCDAPNAVASSDEASAARRQSPCCATVLHQTLSRLLKGLREPRPVLHFLAGHGGHRATILIRKQVIRSCQPRSKKARPESQYHLTFFCKSRIHMRLRPANQPIHERSWHAYLADSGRWVSCTGLRARMRMSLQVRCSSFQNTTQGKCQRCYCRGQECTFQPISDDITDALLRAVAESYSHGSRDRWLADPAE